ncbi:pickpocket protein 28-like [Chironomus tepperi]|uniref:pickpocket protein 28-like n=1 Tax=Chironomus tepperi TaxID=113505 RepID=UPI00391F74D3
MSNSCICESVMTKSSIHGVKYVADTKVSKVGRLLWTLVLVLSGIGCAYFSYQIFSDFRQSPDIGVKVQHIASRNVPFPAITICPQTKIKNDFLSYGKVLLAAFSQDDIDKEEKRYFEVALPLCTASHIKLINQFNEGFSDTAELNSTEFVQTMSEVQFPLKEMFVGMKTDKGFFTENFHEFVDRVMTSEGFCATYNLQDYPLLFKEGSDLSTDFNSYQNNRTSTWTTLDGYKDDGTDQYPKRIFSGSKSKIVFLLAQSGNDIDEACLGPEQGFKIYWHMPNEIPSYMHRSVIVGVEKSKTLVMKATQIRTSDDLQRYDANQRRCFFEDEKPLQFFKSYTKTHCDMECLTNYTLTTCGCVKYFMPRNSSTPVCDISKLQCAEEANDNWLENDKSYRENSMPCNCYPSCSTIKYDVISSTDMDFKTEKTLKAFGDDTQFNEDFPNGTISRFVVEFEDFLIESRESYLGYKIQHLISDFGGLLALFLGCSLISIIEIFYNIFTAIMTRKHKSDDQNEIKPEDKTNSRLINAAYI